MTLEQCCTLGTRHLSELIIHELNVLQNSIELSSSIHLRIEPLPGIPRVDKRDKTVHIINNIMLGQSRRRQRPQSSSQSPSRNLPYRFGNTADLGIVRASISQTFQRENRSWLEIKDLTSDKITQENAKTIDKLCLKYSIIPNQRRNTWKNNSVDVDFLVKEVTRSKSTEMEKVNSRRALKKQLRGVTKLKQKKAKPFFAINCDSIHLFDEKKDCYERQQQRIIKNRANKAAIFLPVERDYPPVTQIEDWQKDHKRYKRVYDGLNKFRAKAAHGKGRTPATVDQMFFTET